MIRMKILTSRPKSPIFIYSKGEILEFDEKVIFTGQRFFLKVMHYILKLL